MTGRKLMAVARILARQNGAHEDDWHDFAGRACEIIDAIDNLPVVIPHEGVCNDRDRKMGAGGVSRQQRQHPHRFRNACRLDRDAPRTDHPVRDDALEEGRREEGGDQPVSKPILALDFDGVIHGYDSGWKGAHIIPDPAVDGTGLYLLKAVQHFRVAIFSSRSRSLRGRRAMRRYIRQLLWDACLAHSDEMERAWKATQGKPSDWIPWTAYDVRDVADHIGKAIEWPWFKPAALMTIDDRALTFNGDWSHPDYQPDAIRKFRPWNKRPRAAA